jgi:hypothetical protein
MRTRFELEFPLLMKEGGVGGGWYVRKNPTPSFFSPFIRGRNAFPGFFAYPEMKIRIALSCIRKS